MTEREHKPKKQSRKQEIEALEREQRDQDTDQISRDSRLTELGDDTVAGEGTSYTKGQRDKRRVWGGEYTFGDDPDAGPSADGQKFLIKPEPKWVPIKDTERQLVVAVRDRLTSLIEEELAGPNRRCDEKYWASLVSSLEAANNLLLEPERALNWDRLLERAIIAEHEARKEDELRENQKPPLPTEHTRRTGREILEWLRCETPAPPWLTPRMIDAILELSTPAGCGRGKTGVRKLIHAMIENQQ